jgi:hypothetical protein
MQLGRCEHGDIAANRIEATGLLIVAAESTTGDVRQNRYHA